MKKSFSIIIGITLLLTVFIAAPGCKKSQSKEEYLSEVLENLNRIKSASYFSTISASAPGDTLSFSEPRILFIKEFVNPADTFVGASEAIYYDGDTTRMRDFYDGFVRGNFNWEKKTVMVDSFQDHPYPFRLVNFPFFTKTASILNYALNTGDSIKTTLTDFGDSVAFSLWIYDLVVEFVTKPFSDQVYESSIGKISQYDIWIHKSDNLPYRMRRKMLHSTSFEAVSEVRLNTMLEEHFKASDHFPPDFTVNHFVREKRKEISDLEGKKAPDWILKDMDQNDIALAGLSSKVLMIQFTGVGCGPCHQSIPFLKQLVNDYKDKDFEFLAIETWSANYTGLKRYYDMNGLNFKFLKTDQHVKDSYQIRSVPVFMILDKNRIIKKVINGYNKSSTDQLILSTINTLL